MFSMDKIQKNVLGEKLEECSLDPLTGWYRDGCCNTDENDQIGLINGLRRGDLNVWNITDDKQKLDNVLTSNDREFLNTIVAEKGADATVISLKNDPKDFLAIVIGANENIRVDKDNLDIITI